MFSDKKLVPMVVFYISSKFLNYSLSKGPVPFPTIIVLGPKFESNAVSIVHFFVLIPNLASDLPYVAYFGRKSTPKFGLPALFERLAFRL